MVSEEVTGLVYCGGDPKSPVERMVQRVKQGASIDTISKLVDASIDKIFLFSNDDDLLDKASGQASGYKTGSSDSFHFGASLREAITAHSIRNPFYLGGAGAPLIEVHELVRIIKGLKHEKNVVYTNNLHSSDFVGFTPGRAIEDLDLPPMDNSLAYLLRDKAGLRVVRLEDTVGMHLDIDTPTDVLVLSAHPKTGRSTREAINAFSLDNSKILLAKKMLLEPFTEVLVCGRFGSSLFSYLNRCTRCRWRVISEERGMKSLGRVERKEVVSLLGILIDEVGPVRFFEYISKVSQLAFIDTRVIFAHLHKEPTASDRFYSDLGFYDEIKDPFIRDFTKAANEADIPVILGGHSLVSGGLWALVDALWCEWYEQRETAKGDKNDPTTDNQWTLTDNIFDRVEGRK